MTVREKNVFLKQNEKTTCLLREFHDDSIIAATVQSWQMSC